MTRREFIFSLLKVAAVTGIYPVISYATAMKIGEKEIKGSDVHISGCMWCQAGCSMLIYLKNNKVVHITGNPDDPVTKGRLCVKPFGSLEILNSSERLRYPLKRINNKLVRVSWDEILDEIAYKLEKLRNRYGPESLGIWASGRSAFDGRLLNEAFSKLYGTPNYAKTGPFCNCSGKIAGVSTVGSRHTPWIYEDNDFYAADLYIFVGSNMAATRPVIFQNLLSEKIKRGCKFICIDPRKSQTAEKSDEWIPIRPGTDMALALGMIHYIISNNLHNEKFIKQKTQGFEDFKKQLFSNGYDINWASKVTEIPTHKIKRLAKLYATTKKAIIIGNSGISHHTNAVQTHRAYYFLAAVTGHFGLPSTGYGCLNNGSYRIGAIPLPQNLPKTRPSLGPNPVDWLLIQTPYKLRGLISTGSPMTQWPEQKKIRSLISKLELSVWNGIVPSVNIKFFKYILPAATWIEAGGLSPVSDDSRFVLVPKLLNPPEEAKPDRWWWIELGKRMGWKEIFRDEFKDYKKLIDYACGRFGFGIRDFLSQQKTHALRAPKGRKTFFLNGKFLTKNGKFKFKDKLLSSPVFYTDPDIARHGEYTIKFKNEVIYSPFHKGKCYIKPFVLHKNKKQNEFPLYLITGRPSSAIMGDASHWSKTLSKISPDQICIIHPVTAKKYQIHNNQKVRIISNYGDTICLAVISPNIKEDVVFVPYSYGENNPYRPYKPINFVTSASAMDPIAGQIAFNGVKIKVLGA